MSLSRRSFLASTVGALATAVIAPQLPTSGTYRVTYCYYDRPELPDDEWCTRCRCMQIPTGHISRDGMAWHTGDGRVFVRVEYDGPNHLRQVPWPGGPPGSTV